ncbi:hypothetical protein CROQUDRAFT_652644 [Cronartium quercuum f. sp. fusiforme G11]|uniref:Uncharacterized protein n=1 Tax=Cronartium quercuum f. sp. fusiforme G11 TaxID=708437 RepID=A0A9P6NQ99_9BASI|nr:hypothetical protein CROQUDRAFT_652644 [Cronartium quercuum f. sp. fusiforme G11]
MPLDPPLYAASQTPSDSGLPFLLNLSTLPPALSFLSGYLGIGPASVQGEVQIKLVSNQPSLSIHRLQLSFRGLERTQPDHQPIDLVQQHQILWDASNSQPSTSNSPEPSKPPATIPFQFPLTPDLPHCIHLPNGCGLHYELEAHVTYTSDLPSDPRPATLKHLHLTVPVHILRYSSPAQQPIPPSLSETPLNQPFTLSPVRLASSSPTPIHVSLSQTLLRHSEPLAIQVRIPPPAEELICKKGLRLRSVKAELHRHIRVRSPPSESPTSLFTDSPKASNRAPPYLPEDELELAPEPDSVITSLLAMSGKSCRFSSTRTVFLRLNLHPRPLELEQGHSSNSTEPSPSAQPATSSRCEAVTQSTILHDVYFSVTVTIQIVGRGGERFDVRLEEPVGVVPDWPPDCEPNSGASGKAREAAEEQTLAEDELGHQGPAPTYIEADEHFPSSSTSATIWPSGADDLEESEDEEEYDGYECFSSGAGLDGPAPPTIDEDESPPPAPDIPPDGIHLAHPPAPADSFGFVCFEPAQLDAGFGPYASANPNPAPPTSEQTGGITGHEDEEAHRPPAYAAGWTTLVPPPVHHDHPTPDTSSASTHTPTSTLNAPPPYAADFGCLPPGSIGVVDQDGELDGFVMRQ